MPDRHFYLLRHHILFYIKFLLFCSLAPDEIKILCRKNKGVSLEEFVNPLDFNFPESHILLVHSMFPNCGFSIVRKKKPYPIPDADEYLKYSDYRADGMYYLFLFSSITKSTNQDLQIYAFNCLFFYIMSFCISSKNKR